MTYADDELDATEDALELLAGGTTTDPLEDDEEELLEETSTLEDELDKEDPWSAFQIYAAASPRERGSDGENSAPVWPTTGRI